MKKIITCLFMSAIILGVVGCSNTANEEKVQEKVPEYKELTDPRGTILESAAMGESNPQIVETLYETKDIVIADYIPTEMGYAVDPTGKTDSTQGIQNALYDCYRAGGGTVYLPVGNYAISDTIYIPPFVTLRGDWQDPDNEAFDGHYGTIISVWMEPEDSEAAGAFKLGGSAGAVGLTVYYPLQSLECIMPYPFAFYVDGVASNYMLSTVRNVTIINGYRGVGTSYEKSHEQLQIDNVKGTFLYYGLSLANSSDVGTVKSFTANNKYWKQASADCMNAVLGSAIDAYTKKYTTAIKIGDLEWTEFNDISIDSCAIGIHTVPGERIEFAGSMYDVTITNCEQGIVLDGMDERWGALLARSNIEGGIVNNTEGKLKLCDVEISGGIKEVKEKSIVIDEEIDLKSYEIDYDASYTKPAENLIVAELSNGLFTDAGPELQKAVDEIAAQGGVVYVPGGVYRFRSPVTVPAGVEIRGTATVATRDQIGDSSGTVFYCYYGDDADSGEEDQAFITLAGENAGVNGIRIIYPENGSKREVLNTTYTIRGTAPGVYVVNSLIMASAYGIDFRNCDNHYIDSVMTTCYYNAFRVGGNDGIITRCLQNGTYMVRTNAGGLSNWPTKNDTGLFQELIEPVLRVNCRMIVIEEAKNQMVYNTFAYGIKTFATNINSENTRLINVGTDNVEDVSPQIHQESGSMSCINVMRYNGYSYEFVGGSIELYNRIAINEVGERNLKKSE